MTDGEYNTEYDKNGVKTELAKCGRGGQRPCGDAGGGLVHGDEGRRASRSGPSGSTSAVQWSASYQMLKQCASDPAKFYPAATARS